MDRAAALLENHYTILGLEPTASKEDIKRAYHKLALMYRPDQHPTAIADAVVRRIKAAYETLSDDEARAAYDKSLRGESPRANEGQWECPRCSLLRSSDRASCECGFQRASARAEQRLCTVVRSVVIDAGLAATDHFPHDQDLTARCLLERLVESGVLTGAQVELVWQRTRAVIVELGTVVGAAALARMMITEQQLQAALAEQASAADPVFLELVLLQRGFITSPQCAALWLLGSAAHGTQPPDATPVHSERVSAAAGMGKKGWECPLCSLLWTSDRVACECGYRRVQGTDTGNQGWECPQCSLLWTTDRAVCECGWARKEGRPQTPQPTPAPVNPSVGNTGARQPTTAMFPTLRVLLALYCAAVAGLAVHGERRSAEVSRAGGAVVNAAPPRKDSSNKIHLALSEGRVPLRKPPEYDVVMVSPEESQARVNEGWVPVSPDEWNAMQVVRRLRSQYQLEIDAGRYALLSVLVVYAVGVLVFLGRGGINGRLFSGVSQFVVGLPQIVIWPLIVFFGRTRQE